MWNGGIDMNKWLYWIKTGLLNILYVAMAAIFFGIFQSLINDELTPMNIASTGLYYALPLSSLIICLLNIRKTTSMVNMVVSMGETRKNTILGINIMNLTSVFTAVAAIALLSILSGGELIDLYTAFVPMPAIYLVAVGCGICINSLKCENTSTLTALQSVLMACSMALLFGLHGMLGIFMNDSRINIDADIRLTVIIFSAACGILLCIIGNIRMRKRIMSMEVCL